MLHEGEVICERGAPCLDEPVLLGLQVGAQVVPGAQATHVTRGEGQAVEVGQVVTWVPRPGQQAAVEGAGGEGQHGGPGRQGQVAAPHVTGVVLVEVDVQRGRGPRVAAMATGSGERLQVVALG